MHFACEEFETEEGPSAFGVGDLGRGPQSPQPVSPGKHGLWALWEAPPPSADFGRDIPKDAEGEIIAQAGMTSDSRCAAVTIIVGVWKGLELPCDDFNGVEDIGYQCVLKILRDLGVDVWTVLVGWETNAVLGTSLDFQSDG